MIPIHELSERSDRLTDAVRQFENESTKFAAPRDTIQSHATRLGIGVWCVIAPKLESAIAQTEHDFGAEGADGWIATLTVDGWLYHHGGIQD